MDTQPGQEKIALQLAANRLGRQLAASGDFYDVIDHLISGYAGDQEGSGTQNPRTLDHGQSYWKLLALAELASVVGNTTQEVAQEARDGGYTWQEIGYALGITRQAAQKRFGA